MWQIKMFTTRNKGKLLKSGFFHVVDRETKEEQSLQQKEIEWLNEWVKENDSSKRKIAKNE